MGPFPKKLPRFTIDYIQNSGSKYGPVITKVTFLECRVGGSSGHGRLGRRRLIILFVSRDSAEGKD